MQGDTCTVEADTIIEGDLFAVCRTLIVDGTVRGHVFSIAAAAQITGTIEGSLYLLGGQANFAGDLAGNLNFAGGLLQIAPSATLSGDDSSLTTLSLSTAAAAPIPGSLAGAGYQLILEGNVAREVTYWGTALQIDGAIGGDVNVQVGEEDSSGAPELLTVLRILAPDTRVIAPGIRLSEDTEISGTLTYAAPAEADFGRVLPNPVEYQPVHQVVGLPQSEDLPNELTLWLSRFATELLLTAILGLLLAAFGARFAARTADALAESPGRAALVGVGSFLFTVPFLAMVLVFSLIVIFVLSALRLTPLALTLGFVTSISGIALTSTFLTFGLFIARLIAAYALARALVRRIGSRGTEGERPFALIMLIGVILIALLTSLPSVGWLFSGAASLIGTGAALITLFHGFRPPQPRARPASTGGRTLALPAPPPIADDQTEALGMENLPQGFTWWDDA
ncbi:MAG: polymer-forming cytoskeletal protein [Chloroflexi bacterium]|nr:polymer-forming cytoskeletal protein [Chloroflexota bacterium]